MTLAALCACKPSPEAAELLPAASPAPSAPQPAPQPETLDRIVLDAVPLGKRVDLPSCKDVGASRPCIDSKRSGTRPTRVHIPALTGYAHYARVVGILEIDGLAEGIWLESQERPGADEAMRDDLVRAFGDPGSIGRDEPDSTEWARWRTGDLHVFWFGQTADRPYGVAIIETPKGELYSTREQARMEAEELKP